MQNFQKTDQKVCPRLSYVEVRCSGLLEFKDRYISLKITAFELPMLKLKSCFEFIFGRSISYDP